ncbi:hypothetical protein OO013_13530 [Mangrovivirga sp. M17]|uniref:Uncharacterized protein n=1 Tax=Mangrovivirga halotolerans TaxID=2993936 RepID=A0ABT3RU70_9BACT|nr:hypothetical protein [Mangrovivirga halotolerans]MCX2744898.1 hypothetical protein [Mangrovivirga halotolerans]
MIMLGIIGVLFVMALLAPWVVPNEKVSDNELDREN